MHSVVCLPRITYCMLNNKKLFMNQQKILLILTFICLCLVTAYAYVDGFNGCGTDMHCFKRLVTSSIYSPIFLPLIALLLSLLPLLFLQSRVYRAWRIFALVGVPVMALLILASPEQTPGTWATSFDLNREMAALLFSGLFVLISWAIILRTALKYR